MDKDRKGNQLSHMGCAKNKVNLEQGLEESARVSHEGSAEMAPHIRMRPPGRGMSWVTSNPAAAGAEKARREW